VTDFSSRIVPGFLSSVLSLRLGVSAFMSALIHATAPLGKTGGTPRRRDAEEERGEKRRKSLLK